MEANWLCHGVYVYDSYVNARYGHFYFGALATLVNSASEDCVAVGPRKKNDV